MMSYQDDLLNDDEHTTPADDYVSPFDFYEHLGNAEMGDELTDDETVDAGADTARDPELSLTDIEANRGFRERLDTADNTTDDDFARSIDPKENPYIGDQLADESLSHDGDDYR